ncbi:OLC1v1011611C1 [Oldenlandia corymbosa var. corymbosa]|uniref:OLC1v1011611C1 n=1 Tax=Oldenlandia corymbosa var. corymbosa TaxID=529605 RepID=A0AAV1DVR9_OLDCO|nr:OLC1v1011611C1 [Oldenlandia corymbosa var. corymbosa]
MTSLNGGAVFLCQDYSLYSSQSGETLDQIDGSYIYFSFPPNPTLFSYRIQDQKVTSSPTFCRPDRLESWISQWLMPAIRPVAHQKLITTTTEDAVGGMGKIGKIAGEEGPLLRGCG